MSALSIARLASDGFYGTATNRLISIMTNGWYDDVRVISPAAHSVTLNVIGERSASLAAVNDRSATLVITGNRSVTLS